MHEIKRINLSSGKVARAATAEALTKAGNQEFRKYQQHAMSGFDSN
jgi:hypothetical protein